MKKRFFLLLTVFILSILLINCEDDSTSPGNTIYGSWVRDITDTAGLTFTAELKINENNTYDFILITQAPGHTNSSAEFTIDGNTISIINDDDCGVTGVYNFSVQSESLTLIVVDDACTPRTLAIAGEWKAK